MRIRYGGARRARTVAEAIAEARRAAASQAKASGKKT
jgi:hypothetical protein